MSKGMPNLTLLEVEKLNGDGVVGLDKEIPFRIPQDKDLTRSFVGKFSHSVSLLLKFILSIDILSSLLVLYEDVSEDATPLGSGDGSPRSFLPSIDVGEVRGVLVGDALFALVVSSLLGPVGDIATPLFC